MVYHDWRWSSRAALPLPESPSPAWSPSAGEGESKALDAAIPKPGLVWEAWHLHPSLNQEPVTVTRPKRQRDISREAGFIHDEPRPRRRPPPSIKPGTKGGPIIMCLCTQPLLQMEPDESACDTGKARLAAGRRRNGFRASSTCQREDLAAAMHSRSRRLAAWTGNYVYQYVYMSILAILHEIHLDSGHWMMNPGMSSLLL